MHVVIGARNKKDADTAVKKLGDENLSAQSVQLDVTDSQSINNAAATLDSEHGRLDVLINNAGVMLDAFDKKPSEQSLAVWHKTFDVNLFGVVAVTQAFLPLLRKAAAARIVNVSSVLGSLSDSTDPASPYYNFKIPAYNISKTALNAWTIHLAHELRETTIKVNAAHPGYVKTDLHGMDAPLLPAEGAKTSVRLALLPESGPSGQFYHFDDKVAW
jgi:NAD(P)-dependent dehydrogenase (short-subunit alcohol dehydrogenase family)